MSDIARVLLRTVVGATMVVHGARHARTLSGTSEWFRSVGFELFWRAPQVGG